MNYWEKRESELRAMGGYESELVPVISGAVRLLIARGRTDCAEIERLRAELDAANKSMFALREGIARRDLELSIAKEMLAGTFEPWPNWSDYESDHTQACQAANKRVAELEAAIGNHPSRTLIVADSAKVQLVNENKLRSRIAILEHAVRRAVRVWGSTMTGDGADGETMATLRSALEQEGSQT